MARFVSILGCGNASFLDDNRRIAVWHFETLDDLGHSTDGINLALAWVFGFHVHLGNHTDKFILVADALNQPQVLSRPAVIGATTPGKMTVLRKGRMGSSSAIGHPLFTSSSEVINGINSVFSSIISLNDNLSISLFQKVVRGLFPRHAVTIGQKKAAPWEGLIYGSKAVPKLLLEEA